MTTAAYLRVSTDRQDANNQLGEITDWCERHHLGCPAVSSEEASTGTAWQQRELGKLVQTLGNGDTIVVSEVTRLARSTLEVLEILAHCAVRGVSIHVVKSALILDGSMHSKIVVTVLALAGEIEREFIRARTRAALDTRRAKGLPMGRPIGSGGQSSLATRSTEIARLLAAGVSVSAVARLCGVSRGTVYRWQLMQLKSKTTL